MRQAYMVTWYSGRPTRDAKLTKLFAAILDWDDDQGWLGLKKDGKRDISLWVTKGYHRVARKLHPRGRR